MKRVYADVDDALFRAFQVKLAQEGERMAPVIRQMVEEYVKDTEETEK